VTLATQWPHLFVSEGHAPREVFSASQLDTASGCKRAWGYRYLAGLKTAEPDYHDYDRLEKRDRTLAFGKALHARLESYFKGETVVWTDDIGQRALVGLHLLPQAPPVRVEEQISISLATSYEPIVWNGFKDLASAAILYDYKTTGDFRWMKKSHELIVDPAANIYALDEMTRSGLNRQYCRWVYFARNDRPEARPVDFTIEREGAHAIVAGLSLDAANLRTTMRDYATGAVSVEDLPFNVATCRKYNGCPYHFSAGGPCTAEATPGAPLVQIDLSKIHEPKNQTAPEGPQQPGVIEMTVAERIAAAMAAQKQAPATPPQGAPFPSAGATPSAPAFAVTPFAPPPAAAAPSPSPFPVVAAPPAVTQPLPPFAGFTPATDAAAPAQAAFGPPPDYVAPQPTPAPFAGINPPEQHTAAPLPPMPDTVAPAPVSEVKTRKPRGPNKPKAGVAAEAAQILGVSGSDLCTVSITITHDNGATLTIPAPVEIAEMFAATLGPTLAEMI